MLFFSLSLSFVYFSWGYWTFPRIFPNKTVWLWCIKNKHGILCFRIQTNFIYLIFFSPYDMLELLTLGSYGNIFKFMWCSFSSQQCIHFIAISKCTAILFCQSNDPCESDEHWTFQVVVDILCIYQRNIFFFLFFFWFVFFPGVVTFVYL